MKIYYCAGKENYEKVLKVLSKTRRDEPREKMGVLKIYGDPFFYTDEEEEFKADMKLEWGEDTIFEKIL